MKASTDQNHSVISPLRKGLELFKGFSWSSNPDRVLIVLALYIVAAILLSNLLF